MHGHARNILTKWLQFTILSRQSSSNYGTKTYRNIFTWSHIFNSSHIRHTSFMREHPSLWKTLFSVQRPMVVLQVGTSSPSSHILFNFISVGIQWMNVISGPWDKLRGFLNDWKNQEFSRGLYDLTRQLFQVTREDIHVYPDNGNSPQSTQ